MQDKILEVDVQELEMVFKGDLCIWGNNYIVGALSCVGSTLFLSFVLCVFRKLNYSYECIFSSFYVESGAYIHEIFICKAYVITDKWTYIVITSYT